MNRTVRLLCATLVAAACLSTYGQEIRQKTDIRKPTADTLGLPIQPVVTPVQGGFAPRLVPEISLPSELEQPGTNTVNPHFFHQPKVDSTMLHTLPAANQVPVHTPFSDDYRLGGNILTWQGGAFTGSSFHETLPALYMQQNAEFGLTQRFGNFTLTATAGADRYHILGSGTKLMFNYGGQMRYNFNENTSVTVFGNYSTNRRFYSMAAMPYMGTKNFGGYLTYMGERLGVDLGVKREYDVFSGRWRTVPIVTPMVKFGRSMTFALPVGELLGEILDNAMHKNATRTGPMIAPPNLQMPGPIPFGSPEIPRGR